MKLKQTAPEKFSDQRHKFMTNRMINERWNKQMKWKLRTQKLEFTLL